MKRFTSMFLAVCMLALPVFRLLPIFRGGSVDIRCVHGFWGCSGRNDHLDLLGRLG